VENIFNYDLEKLAEELKEQFETNQPFPYLAIKGLFNEQILSDAVSEIHQTQGYGMRYRDQHQIKDLIEGKSLITTAPENIQKVFKALNGEPFLKFLQKVTSIEDLFQDNTFRGGGIHHIPPGGKLGIHVDFSRPRWNKEVYRRANVLLYVNKDWKEEWGGHLELWDNSVKDNGKCIEKITPEFNTLVLFGTKKASWHGHPEPLQCPPNRARQSFASYYYSNTPSDDLEVHTTIFN